MQVLPKSLNELVRIIHKEGSQDFSLKGIFLDNFQEMLVENFNDRFSLRAISQSQFYIYAKQEGILVSLDCKYSSDEHQTIIHAEKVWRDPEVLKALLDEQGLSKYEITNTIGARTSKKELILVKVDEVRHLFSQENFEAIGYYIVTKSPQI